VVFLVKIGSNLPPRSVFPSQIDLVATQISVQVQIEE
jgi:hypothetical protein